MNIHKQRRNFDKKTRKLERKYIPLFNAVFQRQLLNYSKAIISNTLDAIYSIDKFFDEDLLKNAYNEMIIECFDRFKIDDPENIIKAIDNSIWTTFVTQYITNVGGNRITQINRFTKAYVLSKLRPILNNGIEEGLGIADIAKNIVSNIAEYSGKFAKYRSERIARTEIIGASNNASLSSIKSAGIEDSVLKKWMPYVDDKTRDTHRDMRDYPAIPLDQDFEVPKIDGGVDLMQFPGDSRGSSANVINCRCTVVYIRR
jgi:hypothetical protein